MIERSELLELETIENEHDRLAREWEWVNGVLYPHNIVWRYDIGWFYIEDGRKHILGKTMEDVIALCKGMQRD